MINISYNNIEYQMPTRFSELTLDSYMRVVEIHNRKDIEPVRKLIETLSILTGIDSEDIRNINMEQINLLQQNISFMFTSTTQNLVPRFTIDGIEYGFNNELSMTSFGEFIDLETTASPENIGTKLPLLMAILYRPVINRRKHNIYNWVFKNIKPVKPDTYKIEPYKIEGLEDRAFIFRQKLTMDVVLGAMFFFTLFAHASILNSKGCSKREILMEMKKYLNQNGITLPENGVF